VATGANGAVMQTPLGVIRLTDVTDGTSNTLLAGEKRMNVASFGKSTDDNESFATSGWNHDWEVYRWGAEPPQPDFAQPGDTNPQSVFGGPHAGGFACVFCDGSVRFVRYSVSPATWQRVCARNDSQAYNASDL
jgi:prepilin-type processing-associated H-X9-DG protein